MRIFDYNFLTNLTTEDNLVTHSSLEDVKNAIFAVKNNSALGPDSFFSAVLLNC